MRYDRTSRLLHWITVLIVAGMIPAGLVMARTEDRALQDTLFIFHKNAGVILFLIILVRLLWRATHRAPALPDDMPTAQRVAARVVHAGLYVVLLGMAASGYVYVVAGGFPMELLDRLSIPPLLAENEALSKRAEAAHKATKFALIALIVMHVAAAAFHGLVRRDGVMRRMWPPA